jgi:hypothetical protein
VGKIVPDFKEALDAMLKHYMEEFKEMYLKEVDLRIAAERDLAEARAFIGTLKADLPVKFNKTIN